MVVNIASLPSTAMLVAGVGGAVGRRREGCGLAWPKAVGRNTPARNRKTQTRTPNFRFIFSCEVRQFATVAGTFRPTHEVPWRCHLMKRTTTNRTAATSCQFTGASPMSQGIAPHSARFAAQFLLLLDNSNPSKRCLGFFRFGGIFWAVQIFADGTCLRCPLLLPMKSAAWIPGSSSHDETERARVFFRFPARGRLHPFSHSS